MSTPAHILDAMLVLRVQAGEQEAFDRLVSRWNARLVAHARVLIGREQEARDAVQETWMAIVRAIHRLDDPEAFAPWMYRTLRYKCIERIRGLQRDRERLAAIVHEGREREDHELSIDGPSPEVELVRRAIESLDAEDREIVSLFYTAGLSTEEIGEAVGMPRNTVKTRLARARAELKHVLERSLHEQHR